MFKTVLIELVCSKLLFYFNLFRIISGKDARYYEGEKKPKIKHDRPGLVSMVHCGDNLYVFDF